MTAINSIQSRNEPVFRLPSKPTFQSKCAFFYKAVFRPNEEPYPKDRKDQIKFLAKKVALASLKELAISLSFTAVACIFVPTPPTMIALIVTAVAVVVFNTLIRTAAAYCTYKSHQTNQPIYKAAAKVLQFLCPLSFGVLDVTTRQVLVHEAGHAIAASIVYNNPRPSIEIKPFEGGVTRYYPKELSAAGTAMGANASRMVVAAAGPFFGIALATADLVLAHKVRKSHPMLRKYLIISAVMNIGQHVFYALSSFWTTTNTSGHDFLKLASGGFHPAAAVATMIAIPLIIKGSLLLASYIKKKRREKYTFYDVPPQTLIATWSKVRGGNQGLSNV